MFFIAGNNEIGWHDSKRPGGRVPDGVEFATAKALTTRVAQWPATRLVEIWNRLPGVTQVQRFRDRKTGVERIWKSIQRLRKAKPPVRTPLTGPTKTEQVLALLKEPSGVTLEALMLLTGWQAHSVRGFLSQVSKKRGLAIHSFKRDGDRVYKIGS